MHYVLVARNSLYYVHVIDTVHEPDAKREKEEGGWRLKVGTMWEFPLNSAGDYGRLQGSDFR